MVLQDYKIEGDYIKVSKAELERKMEQYYLEAFERRTEYGVGFCDGKANFCRLMLELFDED